MLLVSVVVIGVGFISPVSLSEFTSISLPLGDPRAVGFTLLSGPQTIELMDLLNLVRGRPFFNTVSLNTSTLVMGVFLILAYSCTLTFVLGTCRVRSAGHFANPLPFPDAGDVETGRLPPFPFWLLQLHMFVPLSYSYWSSDATFIIISCSGLSSYPRRSNAESAAAPTNRYLALQSGGFHPTLLHIRTRV